MGRCGMALFKIVNRSKKYHDNMAYEDLVSYCTASRKCPHYCITGRAVNPQNAAWAMKCIAQVYGKTDGVRLRHMVLSFSPCELSSKSIYDIDIANKIAWNVMGFFSWRYQILSCVHIKKRHLHIHFLMNTVSYLDGKKYKEEKYDYYQFQTHIKSILITYGISSLKTP